MPMTHQLPMLQESESYVKADLCTPCGGACCKSLPGAAMPEDFGAPDRKVMATKLREAFGSGKWALDWWEGDPRADTYEVSQAYFVRPATKGSEGRIYDPSYGGACTFHSELGCGIFDSRPSGCRGLEPNMLRGKTSCITHYATKQDACIAWLEYEELLEAAAG